MPKTSSQQSQKEHKITVNKHPLSLVGRAIQINDAAPNFKVTDKNLKEVSLDTFTNKIKIITSFVSIDTPVCDLQVKEFNKTAANFAPNIVVIGISKDLPFALERFCAINSINNAVILSDYLHSSFGINYGLLIKENGLLARSIIIIDSTNIIRYIQIVDELTNQPDYAAALKELTKIVKSGPPQKARTSHIERCIPCEAGTPPLPKTTIMALLAKLPTWQLVDDKKIVTEIKFKDFAAAKYCLDLFAMIAEEQGHHPTFTLTYGKLKITLTTHASGGLTNNDFTMARIFDKIVLR